MTKNAATLDGHDDGHAGLVEAVEGLLEADGFGAQRQAGATFLAGGLAGRGGDALPVREDRQVHAGREVLAGRGDHDHAGRRLVIDGVHNGRQLVPEGPVHGVEHLGALQPDMGDLVLGFDVETGPGGHDSSVLRESGWRFPPL
jgi:hypothetical protein